MNKYEVLKKYYGYETLREGQEILIDALLFGRDVLGIMPTGAGKSICYQIPALLFSSVTLVISPLISLMVDQVKALNQAGIHAAYINGALSENQIAKALELARQGRYQIIYVAPERLETARFLDFAMETEISFVAVDEAHCISQWGQDFRPSYVRIADFLRKLPKRPIVGAFTATATERVRADILETLELKDPELVVTGFDRENLFFKVRQIPGGKKKDQEILAYVKDHREENGIIYCATRKNVESVWEMLWKNGVSAGKYHAGMDNDERKLNQEDFIYDKNQVMVATNAFGMGIDKSNVRYVLHYNMPQSLENYYQEAGRAGRDGENAECILYYSPQDLMIARLLLESKTTGQDLDPREASILQEHDEIRLNQMRQYCMTGNCLRQYILQYFDEAPKSDCGNCGNCLAESEEKDVTDLSRNLMRSIIHTRQRYGINVIADILLGRKTAKIKNLGLDETPGFGDSSHYTETDIKSVLFTLEERGLVHASKDKYQILKVTTEGNDFLDDENQSIEMKFLKKEPPVAGKDKKSSKSSKAQHLDQQEMVLFDRLKELRRNLAKEQSVPPYIICSDKTLVELCSKLPADRDGMLQISGIGENKFEKYGEQMLAVIREYQQA